MKEEENKLRLTFKLTVIKIFVVVKLTIAFSATKKEFGFKAGKKLYNDSYSKSVLIAFKKKYSMESSQFSKFKKMTEKEVP